MRRIFKIVVTFVLPALLFLILLLLFALPYGLKNYLNKHGKEYIGRSVSAGDVSINYFTSTLRVLDFKLLESNGKDLFASFDTLQIRIAPFPLLTGKLVVRQFRLVRPEVNIVRSATAYNFDDILAFLEAKPKSEPDGKPSHPFAYFLNNISLEQGKLSFMDQTVNHSTILKELKFFIPSLNFNQDELRDAGIRFHFENGGSLQAVTGFNKISGAYSADISVEKLDLSPFLPYVKDYFHVENIGGLARGNFRLAGKISQPDSILFRGKCQIADFSVLDLNHRKVLAAKEASATMADSYPLKYDFRFDSIRLVTPYLFAEMQDSTINLLNLMVESPSDTVPVAFSYDIKHLEIEEGITDLCDNSYEVPFNYNLSGITLKVDSVSSNSKWLNACASMKLNNRGTLKAQLGINPGDPYELKVDYVIANFLLSDLNPYSSHFVGFPILTGNMYYQGKTTIAGRQLESENKLIIRNAQLGKKSGGIMNLPLKLALYLLKDVHGDIILDLPLTGDLNDPKTRIGPLVWQTLKNVVIKVVASPFIALSGLMGVDPAEAKGLEFNYGDSTLTSKHLKRISLFTEIARKKPDMNIALNYFNDIGLEQNEIAKAEAGKQFQVATGADYMKESARFSAFLREKLGKDSLGIETGCRLLVGERKLDSLQQIFSGARIRQLESALKRFDEATRIQVVVPNRETPENVGSRPVFELKCSLGE